MREALGASAQCLEIEQLDGYLRRSVAAEEAKAIGAHLESCPHCANEMAMLREFLEGETPAGEEEEVRAVAWGLEADRERILGGARRGEGTRTDGAGWWQGWMALLTMPRLSAASAALVLAVSVGLYVRHGRLAEQDLDLAENGTFRTGRVTGVLPAGDMEAIPEKVTWNAMAEARRYQVRMTEVDGTEVWRAEVGEAWAAVPAAARAQVVATKTLLWEVTAMDGAGKTVGISEPTRFRLVLRRR